MIKAHNLRRLEDGPAGGTALYFGDHEIGQVVEAPLPASGGWNLSRIADISLAQTVYQLADRARIWLPTMRESEAVTIPMARVEAIGTIGPGDRDINGEGAGGALRGPFTIARVSPNSASTYPVLWSHDAERERTMAFSGDSEGRPRRSRTRSIQRAIDSKVAGVFAAASHCHFNRDFRFNSQSTAMQFTPLRTIGGRAWPSIRFSNLDHEKAMVLWGNTSFGVLMYWWYANKTQPGRGSILRSKLATLPVLDVTKLAPRKLNRAATVFDETCTLALLPIDQIDTDAARRTLDERFGTEVLGLPPSLFAPDSALDLLRRKIAAEPSIRG